MRNCSWVLFFLLVFSSYAEDKNLLIISNAKELIRVKSREIIWKKDKAKMVLIPFEDFDVATSKSTLATNGEADNSDEKETVTIKQKVQVN